MAGKIGGHLFFDANQNGIKDVGVDVAVGKGIGVAVGDGSGEEVRVGSRVRVMVGAGRVGVEVGATAVFSIREGVGVATRPQATTTIKPTNHTTYRTILTMN